jgi:inositol phosphorylceramide mannosyltransferase catalytic subunit
VSLSVCCLTADPGPRVRELLALVRPFADEIVVAADRRVQEDWLTDYGAHADRLLRLEVLTVERNIRWLHESCAGDWILRLDGDEVPSAALLEQLSELVGKRDVVHYAIPRRWLHPDEGHWLEELPWWPDYQLRLVRNDGLLRFPGLIHTGPVPVRPARYLDAPLYHLALLPESRSGRPATSVRHDGVEVQLWAPGGGRLTERFYRPEQNATRRPARVPKADREAIGRVLHARPSATPTGKVSVQEVANEEPLRSWAERDVGSSAYMARIEPFEPRYRMDLCEERQLFFRVTNLGSERWPWDTELKPWIRAAYRWRLPTGRVFVTEGPRTGFPCEVGPGESVILPLHVRAPGRTGRYVLEVDLVHEHTRWFGSPLRTPVEVAPPDESPPRRRRRPRLGASRPRGPIPRVIHRIWLGDAPLPPEAEEFGDSWARHHPGWESRWWGDDDLRRLVPAEAIERARSHSEQSNLLRYEILRRHGGIYLDTDVECLRPIDQLLDGATAFAAWEGPESVGTAVLGAVPGHPLFEDAARAALPNSGRGVNSPEATGPRFFTLVVADHRNVRLFDSSLFYPYRWDEPHRRSERFPDAYAVHHWRLSWALP